MFYVNSVSQEDQFLRGLAEIGEVGQSTLASKCVADGNIWRQLGDCVTVSGREYCNRKWYLYPEHGYCNQVYKTQAECRNAGAIWTAAGCAVAQKPLPPLPEDPNWPKDKTACEQFGGIWDYTPKCPPGSPCPAITKSWFCRLPEERVQGGYAKPVSLIRLQQLFQSPGLTPTGGDPLMAVSQLYAPTSPVPPVPVSDRNPAAINSKVVLGLVGLGLLTLLLFRR